MKFDITLGPIMVNFTLLWSTSKPFLLFVPKSQESENFRSMQNMKNGILWLI